MEILQIHEVFAVLKDNMTAATLPLSKAKFQEQVTHVIEADVRIAPAAHHLFEDFRGLTHTELFRDADVFWLSEKA